MSKVTRIIPRIYYQALELKEDNRKKRKKTIMPTRSTQQWIRLSLRTPGIFIFGLVMAPCGWVLNLTSTVAPNWRTLHNVPNRPADEVVQQGIWDICIGADTNTRTECSQEDPTYFANQIIEIAQGMMVAGLIVTLIGLAVAIPGVRCWRDQPQWTVAGLGGLLIFCSGVLTLIPIAWYTHILNDVTTVTPRTDVRVGYCIILGYIGGIFQVLGGFVMFIGICRCCGGKNRGETRVDEVPRQPKASPRRINVPSLDRARSSASTSSVPYSKDSLDDDVSFPRAKSPAARSANTSFNGTPYDADL
ncbi:claudin-23-like [Menidia menidia]